MAEALEYMGELVPHLERLYASLDSKRQVVIRTLVDAALSRVGDHDVADVHEQLARFDAGLPEELRTPFRNFLNVAAGALAPNCAPPPGASVQCVALESVRSFFAQAAGGPVFWRGRPENLDEPLLDALRSEAEAMRAASVRRNRAKVSSVGPVASSIVTSQWLAEIAGTFGARWRPSGYATFVFYEGEGDGCSAHVDVGEFDLNLILCIGHLARSQDRSRLVLFPPRGHELRFALVPGELVMFPASALIHGREDLRQDEEVVILAAGFERLPTHRRRIVNGQKSNS